MCLDIYLSRSSWKRWVGPTMLRMLRIIIRVSASGKIIYLLTCVCCWLIKVHKMSEKMAWLFCLLPSGSCCCRHSIHWCLEGRHCSCWPQTHRALCVCARPLVYYLFNNKSVGIISLDALETDIHFFCVHCTDGRTFAARDQTRSGRRPPITHWNEGGSLVCNSL